jgi:hypothetical protein
MELLSDGRFVAFPVNFIPTVENVLAYFDTLIVAIKIFIVEAQWPVL